MTIGAGELRHSIRVDRKTVERTDSGAAVDAWKFLKKRAAGFKFLRGQELYVAQQIHAKVIARASVRAPSGVIAADRVAFRGAFYNVEAVLPDPDSGLEFESIYLSSGLNEG